MKDPFGSSLFVSSSNVEIRPLQRAFHKTTASYKFLWFKDLCQDGCEILDSDAEI